MWEQTSQYVHMLVKKSTVLCTLCKLCTVCNQVTHVECKTNTGEVIQSSTGNYLQRPTRFVFLLFCSVCFCFCKSLGIFQEVCSTKAEFKNTLWPDLLWGVLLWVSCSTADKIKLVQSTLSVFTLSWACWWVERERHHQWSCYTKIHHGKG